MRNSAVTTPVKTLPEWLAWLEQIHPIEIDMGLERLRDVAGSMAALKPAPLVITVAGTNGKGSTVTMLDSILRHAGLRTGVYTSPHFLRYNERVRINGEEVSDQALCDSFAAIEEARGDISLTYFEFGTLAALDLFSRSELDIAILEVGLGGRLDAVNIVDPDIAVVTSIGVDHEAWLGSDLNGIAREKAGIFRAGKPAIFSSLSRPESIDEVAGQLGVDRHWRGEQFELSRHSASWDWQGKDKQGRAVTYSDLPLPHLPIDNAAGVLQVLELLPMPIERSAIEQGLKQARLVGRFQQITLMNSHNEAIELIIDVAHNPHAAEYLAGQLELSPCSGKTRAVMAILADKDAAGVTKALSPLVSEWFVSQVDCPRAMSAAELAAELERQGCGSQSFDSVAMALQAALSDSRQGDRILVSGSFYTAADALDFIDDQSSQNNN